MANINLLPWREDLRHERQRQFLSILGLVALLGVAVVGSVYTVYENKLDNQRTRNQYLQGELRKLDSKIKAINALEKERIELIDRMQIIQNLQKSRPQVVHIFDEIAETIPEGVNLSSIKRVKDKLIFNGVAESGPRISNFMRRLNTSMWLKVDKLDKFSPDKSSGSNRKKFVLTAKISSPSNNDEVKP